MLTQWLCTPIVAVAVAVAVAAPPARSQAAAAQPRVAAATRPTQSPIATSQPSDRRPEAARRRGRRQYERLLRQWQRLRPRQRDEMRRIWENLKRMPPEKRQRLLQVLWQYRQWLSSLPADERRRVLAMSPKDRLAYMQLIVKPPSPED